MIHRAQPAWTPYARVVEANIADVIDEILAIDLVDVTSFIRMESFPTVDDLVKSSTELYFRPDMLVFSWSAAVDLRWHASPAVTLGMEFRHPVVSVFFDLRLGRADPVVDVLGVVFERPEPDPLARLRAAFAEARLVDGAAARPSTPTARGGMKRAPWTR